MCLTLLKEKDALVSKEILNRCFDRNPDGAGFAYAKDNRLQIKKGFFEFEKFWGEFDKIQKDHRVMVHFRAASHGEINVANCHPWRIDHDIALCHNGVIFEFADNKSKISDTGHYVRQILRPLFRRYRTLWRDEIGKFLLEQSVGYYSKVIIMSATGKVVILNEEQGLWEDGVWYSNDGFRDISTYEGTTYPRQLEFELETVSSNHKSD